MPIPANIWSLLPDFIRSCNMSPKWSETLSKPWRQHYTALTFLLWPPTCGVWKVKWNAGSTIMLTHTTWHKAIEELEVHVTRLTQWSCKQVRGKKWRNMDIRRNGPWVLWFVDTTPTTPTMMMPLSVPIHRTQHGQPCSSSDINSSLIMNWAFWAVVSIAIAGFYRCR